MTAYDLLKVLHIVGTVLIFGTGIGTAFFLLMAYRSRDLEAIRVTTRHVVVADWLFTAPAVIVQPITGAALMHVVGMRFDSAWFAAVAALYVLTGLCWIPVVAIQYRLRGLARAAAGFATLSPEFHRLMRWWMALGVPAFTAVLLIIVLMVTHAGANLPLFDRPVPPDRRAATPDASRYRSPLTYGFMSACGFVARRATAISATIEST